jgi:acyl-coenzyme A thioesterase PaaI-like protein
MANDAPVLNRPDRAEEDHNCFGCGRLNEHGLQLDLVPDPEGDGVRAAFVPPVRTEGYTGMVHGGIITTVLDEVMAWSLYRHDIWAVTGQLTTRYRKPIPLGERTTARGFLVRDRGRAVEVRGEIRRDADGALLADGTAIFIRVPESQARTWQERYGAIGNRATGVEDGR